MKSAPLDPTIALAEPAVPGVDDDGSAAFHHQNTSPDDPLTHRAAPHSDFTSANAAATALLKADENKFSSTAQNSPAPAIDRCGSLVTDQVAHFRHSGADSLSVVLRPDKHTELLLHISAQHGQVVASLRFERGDLAHFQTHWGELQERLAQQQIQLAPLREPLSISPLLASSASPQSDPGDSHSPRRGSRASTSSDEDLAWIGSNTDPIKPRPNARTKARAPRLGWETWA